MLGLAFDPSGSTELAEVSGRGAQFACSAPAYRQAGSVGTGAGNRELTLSGVLYTALKKTITFFLSSKAREIYTIHANSIKQPDL